MGRQDYDQLAEAYQRHRGVHPDVLDVLIERGGIESGTAVLEIGCGTGNYIHEIAGRTYATCQGVDPSHEMLRRARSNSGLPKNRREAPPEITFVQGRAEDLPFADRQFDLVYSVDVIHHIGDREAAAREAYRVLKPDGMAVIVTESEDDLRKRTPHITYFPEIVDVELARYPTIETMQRELAAAGLEIIDTVSVSRPIEVDDITPFRDKAYSSLHLIPDEAFNAGMQRMEVDAASGPIPGERRYTIVIARKPA